MICYIFYISYHDIRLWILWAIEENFAPFAPWDPHAKKLPPNVQGQAKVRQLCLVEAFGKAHVSEDPMSCQTRRIPSSRRLTWAFIGRFSDETEGPVHLIICREENVLWLYIAIDDAVLLKSWTCPRELQQDWKFHSSGSWEIAWICGQYILSAQHALNDKSTPRLMKVHKRQKYLSRKFGCTLKPVPNKRHKQAWSLVEVATG